MSPANMYDIKPDNDTLGGRLVRARDSSGMSASELAKHVGVKKVTLEAWEADRSEPRSNRLSMLAGILGVSPTWLLHGIGTSPQGETFADEIRLLRRQLAQLRELHEKTGEALVGVENAIVGLEVRGEE
jgi:transcriptional regulator with XRE-family HTH domain